MVEVYNSMVQLNAAVMLIKITPMYEIWWLKHVIVTYDLLKSSNCDFANFSTLQNSMFYSSVNSQG